MLVIDNNSIFRNLSKKRAVDCSIIADAEQTVVSGRIPWPGKAVGRVFNEVRPQLSDELAQRLGCREVAGVGRVSTEDNGQLG